MRVWLLVSLRTLVSGGCDVALADNWNLSDTEKVSAKITSLNDQKLSRWDFETVFNIEL